MVTSLGVGDITGGLIMHSDLIEVSDVIEGIVVLLEHNTIP